MQPLTHRAVSATDTSIQRQVRIVRACVLPRPFRLPPVGYSLTANCGRLAVKSLLAASRLRACLPNTSVILIWMKGSGMGFPKQQQEVPGVQSAMDPVKDCGENSYRGSGRLTGKRAVITGGDSGIGRAVAIAYARGGADVLISYLNEDEDAAEVARHVEDAGRRCVLVRGDLADPAHCRVVIDRAAAEFGGIDVLVSTRLFR